MTQIDHKQRYELLFDRRRALRDYRELARRIQAHPRWEQLLQERPEMQLVFDDMLQEALEQLTKNPAQAESQALLKDVRQIYRGLVSLAKLWVGLETHSRQLLSYQP